MLAYDNGDKGDYFNKPSPRRDNQRETAYYLARNSRALRIVLGDIHVDKLAKTGSVSTTVNEGGSGDYKGSRRSPDKSRGQGKHREKDPQQRAQERQKAKEQKLDYDHQANH